MTLGHLNERTASVPPQMDHLVEKVQLLYGNPNESRFDGAQFGFNEPGQKGRVLANDKSGQHGDRSLGYFVRAAFTGLWIEIVRQHQVGTKVFHQHGNVGFVAEELPHLLGASDEYTLLGQLRNVRRVVGVGEQSVGRQAVVQRIVGGQ
jgi:hypothetical protein